MLRLFNLACEDTPLPKDRLQVENLVSGKALLQAQSGIPFSSDSLAYEPVQRLLAVSRLRLLPAAADVQEGYAEQQHLLESIMYLC